MLRQLQIDALESRDLLAADVLPPVLTLAPVSPTATGLAEAIVDSQSPVEGDVDGNGAVDVNDFLKLSANFGSDDASRSEGDLDGDGIVSTRDFLILSRDIGESSQTDRVFEALAKQGLDGVFDTTNGLRVLSGQAPILFIF